MKAELQSAFNEFWEAGVKSDFRLHALTVHHYPDANRTESAFRIVGDLFAECLPDLDESRGCPVKETLIYIAGELGLEVPIEK